VSAVAEPAAGHVKLVHAARISAYHFIKNFVWIQSFDEKTGMGGPPVHFDLWECQERALEVFEENTNVVVLKARQLGLSWLALAYALWLATCNRGITVLILNRNLGTSIDLLNRIRFMHRHLPDELRIPMTQDTNDATMPQVVFGSLNSRIVSLPSTEDSGSGLTANLILGDELSKWHTPEATMTAILPTMPEGAKLINIFTAKGYNNYAARLWMNALPGAERHNSFTPLFIPDSAHPQRSEAWREKERVKYPDDRRFLQEHPLKWQDAFQTPGETVFGDEFDRNVHALDATRTPNSPYPVYHGIDPGYHHGVAYLIEWQANRMAFVFAEIHCEHQTVAELGKAIVEADGDFELDSTEIMTFYDPAALGTNMQTGIADADVLAQAGLAMADEPNRHPPSERVDLVKTLLRNGQLWISEDCPLLLLALERAQWATKRAPGGDIVQLDTYQKDGVHEHPLDAVGEALVRIVRGVEPEAEDTFAAVGVAPHDPYGGSVYGG
jgi:hypothetical protein